MNFMYKIAELIYSCLSGVISGIPITNIINKIIKSLDNYNSKNDFVKFVTAVLNLLFMSILITIYASNVSSNTSTGITVTLLVSFILIPSVLTMVAFPIALIFEEILDHPVINKSSFESFLGYVISYGAFYIGLFTILLILFF